MTAKLPLLLTALPARAAEILAPGDPIIAIDADGEDSPSGVEFALGTDPTPPIGKAFYRFEAVLEHSLVNADGHWPNSSGWT